MIPEPGDPVASPIARRSVQDRLAAKTHQQHELVESGLTPIIAAESTTSTFRIDVTGELVVDEATSLAAATHVDQSLGELDLRTAQAYHLLALPAESTGEQIEALAISVWNEAGWINPGVLHLTEGVTVEGPWALSTEAATAVGFREAQEKIWLLRCPPLRGAAPTPQILKIDEWARAFPDGMPIGGEHKALLVLRRIARRLSGSLRVAGTGHVMTPDPDGAVNLRVYSSQYLDRDNLLMILRAKFPETTVPPGPAQLSHGDPYALLVPAGRRSQMIVGVRPIDQVPRVLRWENWVRHSVFLYEFNWVTTPASDSPTGLMTRSQRLERTQVKEAIGRAALLTAQMLPEGAVIDEDDFLLGLDELPQAEEGPRL